MYWYSIVTYFFLYNKNVEVFQRKKQELRLHIFGGPILYLVRLIAQVTIERHETDLYFIAIINYTVISVLSASNTFLLTS